MPECRIGQPRTLLLTNLWLAPDTNAVEIFNSNAKPECTCLCNEFLGNTVIDVFLVARLPARKTFQPPLSRLRAVTLKCLSCFHMPLAMTLDIFSRETFCRRIGSDVDDAKINTKKRLNNSNRRFWNVSSTAKKELIVSIDKIS